MGAPDIILLDHFSRNFPLSIAPQKTSWTSPPSPMCPGQIHWTNFPGQILQNIPEQNPLDTIPSYYLPNKTLKTKVIHTYLHMHKNDRYSPDYFISRLQIKLRYRKINLISCAYHGIIRYHSKLSCERIKKFH